MMDVKSTIAEWENRTDKGFDFYPTEVLEIMKLTQDEANGFNMLFAAVVNALKYGYVAGQKAGAQNPN